MRARRNAFDVSRITQTQTLSAERLAFVRAVYGWFAASIALACVAAASVVYSVAVASWALPNYRTLWFAEMGIILLSWFLRDRKPFNILILFGFAAITGLMLGATTLALSLAGRAEVVPQAATITVMTFAGLTFYAWTTRKDFSFLRGFLMAGMWGLFGVGIAAMIFGFGGNGMFFVMACAGVVVGAGFILYDTSNIIHHYQPGQEVGAAFHLYWSVVYLLWNLISLILSATSRD